ncbi:MAG: class I SAM-dependent methyltransferase [Spirochaetales bacterium]|nr:class I SAM-dependent methyltransferase [Spirochaetales bacterium]
MDSETFRFYQDNAAHLSRLYGLAQSPIGSVAHFYFGKNARVLDIGCGSGRDVSALCQIGFDCYGVDPSAMMVEAARASYPDIGDRLKVGGLPNGLDGLFEESLGWDGVILSAVIMHLSDAELFSSIYEVRKRLNLGGRIILSHCTARADLVGQRAGDGRLFILRSTPQIALLFEGLGFEKIAGFDSSDALDRDIAWETLVFEFKGKSSSDSIDRIESIINNDKKPTLHELLRVGGVHGCASWG